MNSFVYMLPVVSPSRKKNLITKEKAKIVLLFIKLVCQHLSSYIFSGILILKVLHMDESLLSTRVLVEV